mmetsp:Transcript_20997/g.29066  ORF Transcript_20997/g.29066 Transcript_20997/m.29066 type:complete len:205 (+) Transcript_20997:2-616(+)
MLLHVYMFSAPLVIGAFLDSNIFGTVLSFFSVLGYFALNKTAEELEDPFGTDPNDLPLDTYLNTFRNSMFSIGIMKSKSQWGGLRTGVLIGKGAAKFKSSAGTNKEDLQSPESSAKIDEIQSLEEKTARLMSTESFKAILPPSVQDLTHVSSATTKEEQEESKTSSCGHADVMNFFNPQVIHTKAPMTAVEKKKYEDLSFYHQL